LPLGIRQITRVRLAFIFAPFLKHPLKDRTDLLADLVFVVCTFDSLIGWQYWRVQATSQSYAKFTEEQFDKGGKMIAVKTKD
jgi:hypothetical protein